MSRSKRLTASAYRCDCGHVIASKTQLADVWCLACGRLMRPARRTTGTQARRKRVQEATPDRPADPQSAGRAAEPTSGHDRTSGRGKE